MFREREFSELIGALVSGLRPARTVAQVWAMLAATLVASAAAQDVPYDVGDWPEALGNHRARIRVEQQSDAVWVHLPWRRRDAAPDRIETIVIDAATNQRVQNVLRVNIQRQFGDLLFQPVTVPGEYFVYYLPYKTEGSWYFPTTVYVPPSSTAQAAWAEACQPIVERLRRGNTADLPAAQVLQFQAINEFHRFDPMEVVASDEELKSLLAAHPGRPYLLFPEDRKYPIRMTDELPLRWVRSGPSQTFAGEACRGEFYAWQIGLYASSQGLEEVAAEFGDLTAGDEERTIPAAALTCLNLSGTDWLGRPLRKAVSVPHGKVQALWFSVAVPRGRAGDLPRHGDVAGQERPGYAGRPDTEGRGQGTGRRRRRGTVAARAADRPAGGGLGLGCIRRSRARSC